MFSRPVCERRQDGSGRAARGECLRKRRYVLRVSRHPARGRFQQPILIAHLVEHGAYGDLPVSVQG